MNKKEIDRGNVIASVLCVFLFSFLSFEIIVVGITHELFILVFFVALYREKGKR